VGARRAYLLAAQAARGTASESVLAHESGPGSTVLAGRRQEVLEAMLKVIEASLVSGAHIVQVKVEAEADAGRFGGRS
jgi:hypothetical protein